MGAKKGLKWYLNNYNVSLFRNGQKFIFMANWFDAIKHTQLFYMYCSTTVLNWFFFSILILYPCYLENLRSHYEKGFKISDIHFAHSRSAAWILFALSTETLLGYPSFVTNIFRKMGKGNDTPTRYYRCH